MATWIKAGFWEKLCKPCKGYKGWLNLDQFVKDNARPYKVYTALLTQEGTNPPVATVLENTLGFDVIWTRFSDGIYQSQAAFDITKTAVFAPCSYDSNSITHVVVNTSNQVTIITSIQNGTTMQFENKDDALYNSPIEIRVYP